MKTKFLILALAVASGACCFGYEAPAWRIASDASGVTISVDVDEPLADLPGEPENELEIFFAPFPNDNRYYQFYGDLRERTVGPYYWSKGGDYARFADWKVDYGVQKGKGYRVKASVPWGDLRNCAPVTGGVWRVAVARTRQGGAFKITSGAPHEPKTWAAVALPALDAASAAEAQRRIAAAKAHPKEVKLRVWAKPGEKLPITSPCPKLDPDGEERWGVRQRAELRHARIARMAKEGCPPRVFMLGDSITEWFAPKPWARLARFAPANLGVSGDVIENVLWRIDLGMFDAVKPEALVLLIGTNNGGNTPEERARGVAAIVDKIREKSPGTKILLYGIFPRGKTWPAEKNPLKETNALLAKLAAEKGVAFADVTASFLAADGVTVRQELFRDGLHPNEAGDDVWVDSLERELGKLLGEPRADALPPVPFIRGVKAMLPGRDAFGDYRVLVDMMAHFGLNTLMLELGGAMEYKSHPEVNEGWIEYAKIMNEHPGKTLKIQHAQKWHKNSIHSENGGGGVLTQKEIAELAAYARARGIEIIPEVPCLSHSDYLLWRHRELAERQNDPHPDSYCPSDPRSYELLFDLLDEVVALFKPRIVNVGHDEWYSIGVCDKCRGKNAAELYAGDVRKIRDHLAAKGVRTMMWAEKLLDFKFCDSKKPWAGAATEEFPATHPAIDMLPKDVVMLHWYWSLGRTLENAFADRGFTWVFGNYSARGMLDYPGRSRKRGFSGYMLSNWGRSDIPTLQRNGVLADIVMDKLVEESKDPDAEIDALWDRMFKELFALRHPADRTYYRLRHHATRKREFRCFFDGFYVKREDWLLGRYVLTLADGGKVTHDVLYGENVTHADVDWNPPREWDTDARRGRGELAAVAYSTLPVRQGGRTTYEIAIEIPKGAQVVSCVFEPAEGQPKDAVAFEPVTPPAPPPAAPFSTLRLPATRENWPAQRAMLARSRDCFDEVWFSACNFKSLAENAEKAKWLGEAAREVRAMGYVASLEFELTIGNTDTPECKRLPFKDWTGFTGPEGWEGVNCNCPRDPRFHAYFREQLKHYGAWAPTVIWLDDDVRVDNHGDNSTGCFCARCLEAFSKQEGKAWTREALVAATKTDSALAARWREHCFKGLGEFAYAFCRAAKEFSPTSRLGLQYPWADEGQLHVVEAMVKATGEPIEMRPGCCSYTDVHAYDQIDKTYRMQCQVKALLAHPEWFSRLCPEIETYPRTFTTRTARSLGFEALVHLASGLDSLTWYVAGNAERPELYERTTFRAPRENMWLYREYVRRNRGAVQVGFGAPAGERFTKTTNGFRPVNGTSTIPYSFGAGVKLGTVFWREDQVAAADEAALKKTLAGAVLATREAAAALVRRGLVPSDAAKLPSEQYSDSTAHFPKASKTAAGGTLVVYPSLDPMGATVKTLLEYAHLADAACGGRLPVLFEDPALAVVLPRAFADGSFASAVIVNTRIEEQAPVRLRLRNFKSDAALWFALWSDGPVRLPVARDAKTGDALVTLPPIGHWSGGFIAPERP